MTAVLCGCGRPVADQARICATCTERLARDLGDIGALADEVQTTRLRQSRSGGQATGVLSRPHERPLPWNETASEAAELLRGTVLAWVRTVLDERGGRLPVDTMQALSGFLLLNLEWIRHHEHAEACADEIGHAVATARRVIDQAPDRLYIGPCDPNALHNDLPCGVDLYAREGRQEVACPACDLVWNVQDRRAYLLQAAQDQLATPAVLSRFLSMYGEPLTDDRIRKWAERGQLVAHGRNASGKPLYLIGEAVALLARMSSKGRAA